MQPPIVYAAQKGMCTQCVLRVSPTQGAGGTKVTITGAHWTHTSTNGNIKSVNLTFQPVNRGDPNARVTIGTVTVAADGTFRTAFTIPQNIPAGDYNFWAVNTYPSPDEYTKAPFTVSAGSVLPPPTSAPQPGQGGTQPPSGGTNPNPSGPVKGQQPGTQNPKPGTQPIQIGQPNQPGQGGTQPPSGGTNPNPNPAPQEQVTIPIDLLLPSSGISGISFPYPLGIPVNIPQSGVSKTIQDLLPLAACELDPSPLCIAQGIGELSPQAQKATDLYLLFLDCEIEGSDSQACLDLLKQTGTQYQI